MATERITISNRHYTRLKEQQFLSSDIEHADNRRKEYENAAEKAIIVIGDLLDNADTFLSQLESDQVFGSAIVRCCQELADVIENLVGEIDRQSEQEKQAFAQACLKDARASWETRVDSCDLDANQIQLANMSERDMMDALSGAQSLLKDVEESLRSIDRREADEIADVAIVMARLFIMSLKQVHSNLTPERILTVGQSHALARDAEFSSRIVVIEEDGSHDEHTCGELRGSCVLSNVRQPPIDRLRVLWPPLGPAVVSAAQWGKDEAAKRPILAVALGLTLWPTAIIAALIGSPIVLADCAVQQFYKSLDDGPIILTVERGAAQIYHAGRLSFLCSSLMMKQSLRVVSRQVKRHGGVGKLALDVGGALVDRLMHPIETAHMTWDGFCIGAGAIRDGVNFVQGTMDRRRERTNEADIVC